GNHGQVWLATHSIPVVAYGGMDSVYLIKDNGATYARNRIDEVMTSLLGGMGGRENLQNMLADADKIGMSRFLAECFIDPTPVDTAPSDPQKTMLLEILSKTRKLERATRLLDYGAGRGRLATGLSTYNETSTIIEYHAFNRPEFTRPLDRDACIA